MEKERIKARRWTYGSCNYIWWGAVVQWCVWICVVKACDARVRNPTKTLITQYWLGFGKNSIVIALSN